MLHMNNFLVTDGFYTEIQWYPSFLSIILYSPVCRFSMSSISRDIGQIVYNYNTVVKELGCMTILALRKGLTLKALGLGFRVRV